MNCWVCGKKINFSVRLDIECCQKCLDLQSEMVRSIEINNPFEPPDFVVDNVYLGSQRSAIDLEQLQSRDIGAVLVSGDHLTLHFPEQIEYHILNIEDSPLQNIKSYFAESITFIRKSRRKVLVHCASGISRSATIVLAYLMTEHRMSLSDATRYLKDRRPVIHPNSGFQKQLKEYAREVGVDDSFNVDEFF